MQCALQKRPLKVIRDRSEIYKTEKPISQTPVGTATDINAYTTSSVWRPVTCKVPMLLHTSLNISMLMMTAAVIGLQLVLFRFRDFLVGHTVTLETIVSL